MHVAGSFNTTRAAWPHMVEQGYGRIVMTTSAGMFGLPTNLSYATAKGGVIGLTRSLATAGAAHGIKVNLIAPAAMTRMAGQPAPTRPRTPGDADGAGARRADGRVPRPRGLPGQRRDLRRRRRSLRPHLHRLDRGLRPRRAEPTIEDVAEHWATINDETGYYRPRRPHGLVGRLHWPTSRPSRVTESVAQLALEDLARRVPRAARR